MNNYSEDISIIIPVRNEKDNFEIMINLLESIVKINHEILIVYDNDEDTTRSTTVSDKQTSSSEDADDIYDEAVGFVIESRRASISAVQRKFRIGYNRAARLIETMEEAGLVSEMSSNGSREVLVPKNN